MKYARQVQANLDRLDQTLLALNKLIRAGKQQEAIEFMENGPFKDAYENLQNIVTVAGGPGSLGASGVANKGTVSLCIFYPKGFSAMLSYAFQISSISVWITSSLSPIVSVIAVALSTCDLKSSNIFCCSSIFFAFCFNTYKT